MATKAHIVPHSFAPTGIEEIIIREKVRKLMS